MDFYYNYGMFGSVLKQALSRSVHFHVVVFTSQPPKREQTVGGSNLY